MAFYITREVLKDRLILRNIPLPTIDADLDEIITSASDMVADRVDTTLYTPTTPPDRVKRATLILAMRMRTAETINHVDSEGNPMRFPLWTQDLTDLLGKLIVDITPQSGAGSLPLASVMSKTAIVDPVTGWPDPNSQRYAGNPNPDLGIWREGLWWWGV